MVTFESRIAPSVASANERVSFELTFKDALWSDSYVTMLEFRNVRGLEGLGPEENLRGSQSRSRLGFRV